MKNKIFEQGLNAAVSRRTLLQAGAGLAGGAMLPGGMIGSAFAADHPPIGTYPAGSSGPSVFIGIAVPRTGTYAVQGEDELKGYQLAVEHINSGHELIKKISPKTTKGVLGKEVKYGVADSGAKPNDGRAGAATLHHREQGGADDRLDLECGRGGLQQAGAARKGALRRRHFRLQRHHRQGLRSLRLPSEFLRSHRGGGDRSGSRQVLRQEQEGRLYDAGLHLRTHRHEIDAGLSQDRGLDHRDQPGLAARRAGLSVPICSTSPIPAPMC